MVMRTFHTLLKDVTKDIIEEGRHIFPTNLLKVIRLVEKCTVSELVPLEKLNT